MSPKKNKPDNYSTNVRVGFLKRILTFVSLYILWFIRRKPTRKLLFKHFFTPKSYKISQSEKLNLQKGQRSEITVNDQKVVYWQWGSGPIVLFSHGWNGRGIQFLPFFDKLIEKGFSVVAFDGPAHGESEGKTCSYFQMSDTVRALINHFSKDKIHGLIGHSFGASAIINALHKENLQIPAVLIAPAIKLRQMLQKTIKFHGVPLLIFNSLINEYERKYGYHFINDNPYNILKSFQPEALILHDSEDNVTLCSVSREVANLYKSIHLITTDGLGHIRILKDEDVIEKAIDYLSSFNSDNNLSVVDDVSNNQSFFNSH